jgi:hypothetical protein
MFADYLEGCQERDPDMPQWNESTRRRLRSSVFQMLAQAGYIENTRSLRLQNVHVADQVLHYLKANGEEYVLRCIPGVPMNSTSISVSSSRGISKPSIRGKVPIRPAKCMPWNGDRSGDTTKEERAHVAFATPFDSPANADSVANRTETL